jgi:acetyltransferase-like isoleucine patch superfamily enzyme
MQDLNRAFETPWKILNELLRWATYPRVRLKFALNGIEWRQGWRFYGMPIIQKHRHSWMSFGSGLRLRSSIRSNPLAPYHPVILSTRNKTSRLEVGVNFSMTGGTICTAETITVGNNVNVGSNSTLIDTDFHPLDPKVRHLSPQDGLSAPINICDDVFIGMNCVVLKGVTIGQGSVIGTGSVVASDVPPHVIAAGNPARLVRELPPRES